MNFETARMAMVELQIRPNGVRDPRVLNAFATIPRECFVPEGQKGLAYMDEAVLAAPATPHSPARYLLSPMVLARLLQFAEPHGTARALDVGGATGYSAAIFLRFAGRYTRLRPLNCSQQGRSNASATPPLRRLPCTTALLTRDCLRKNLSI